MENKKRLIDADALYRRLNSFIATAIYKGINDIPLGYESCNPTEYLKGYERGAVEAANLALGQPTVDAVEVVRCGVCQYCDTADCPMSGTKGRVSASDFCSYGERREGE